MEPSAKVPSACQRCRRQKLKCDIQRPCTLCSRAGVECISTYTDSWKTYRTSGHRTAKGSGNGIQRQRNRRSKQAKTSNPATQAEKSNPRDARINSDLQNSFLAASTSPDTSITSSSTLRLVVEALQYHETAPLSVSQPSSFGLSQSHGMNSPTGTAPITDNEIPQAVPENVQHEESNVPYNQGPGYMASRFSSALPSAEVAHILIDNFFDHIHWFLLLFHQEPFRDMATRIYDEIPTRKETSLGDSSVVLAVMVLSLKYLDPQRHTQLCEAGVAVKKLLHDTIATLRFGLLDILALGSLQSVQTCVLLGSYYLYHGDGQMAWTLCGCGLRIAQAINLHRKLRVSGHLLESHQARLDLLAHSRKRCWWAIYEMDTFCSMLYGFPQSISVADCDVEPLSGNDSWSSSSSSRTDEPSLLVFKSAMSELSKIMDMALRTLYSPEHVTSMEGPVFQYLVNNVMSLDSKLVYWQSKLPPSLQLWDGNTPNALLSSFEDSPTDCTSANKFERRILNLQALALDLAFCNARIMVHRPLLSHRLIGLPKAVPDRVHLHNHMKKSISTCREVALRVSRIYATNIFSIASDTYAVTFIAIHLFTAGVTLSIVASLNPLSTESLEAKLGIRRIMALQRALRHKSAAAEQALGILKRLTSLVLHKESEKMFEPIPLAHTISDPSSYMSLEHSVPATQQTELFPLSNLQLQMPADNNTGSREHLHEVEPDAGLDIDSWLVPALFDIDTAAPNQSTDNVGDSAESLDTFLGTEGELNTNVQDPRWIWNWNYDI